MNTTSQAESAHFELRFQSLVDEGGGFAFPCDAGGRVDIDTLSHKLRLNYLFARALVGRNFSMPAVISSVPR